jgi:endonuclease-3
MTRKERANLVLKRLDKKYKNYPPTGLKNWKKPWQFLFCVILSAQATDDQINKLSSGLFKKFPKLANFADAPIKKIESAIKSAGFYRMKAKSLQNSARLLLTDFKGKIPNRLDLLIKLPGVGRKTANVYQGVMHGKSEGIAVDTHVSRMSNRLDLSRRKSADNIEEDLMKLFPKSKYHRINPILFWHGRTVCISRKPQCDKCELNDFCPSAFKV